MLMQEMKEIDLHGSSGLNFYEKSISEAHLEKI